MDHQTFFDSHTHTRHFSIDGQQTLDELVNDALEKGLAGIVVSEHYDKDMINSEIQAGISPVGSLPQPEEWIFNIEAYFNLFLEKKMQLTKARAPLQLLSGIELGYLPYLPSAYDELVRKHPFDCVIGSVHTLKYLDIYMAPQLFEVPKIQVYEEYLETIIEMITRQQELDIVGHYDFIVRKAPYEDNRMLYRELADHFDTLFRLIIEKGKSFEINTRSRYKAIEDGKPDPGMIDPDIIRRYLELGGEMITLSSDSHDYGHVANYFKESAAELAYLGVRYLTHFENRKPQFIKLDS
ncbi:MAG: histidinol-phosphatase HisJ family protein [Fastidiosipilaceae bacterium]|nr:histidinol-phosphatase HisJ family protein [Clostridiaceae bacterium]